MKRIAVWVGIAVAVLLVIAVALPFLIDANAFRPKLESSLTAALGRDVKLGDLKLSLFSGGVSASDLSIADDPAFSKTPFVRAKQLSAGVHLAALIFSRKLDVTGITIDQPEIALVESSPGVWNFSSLGTKATNRTAPPAASGGTAGLDLSVKQVKITNGRLTVNRSGSSKPVVVEQVNVEMQDFSPGSSVPFSATATMPGGGALKLDGKAGPLDPADAAMTPVDAHLSVSHLDLARSRMNDWAPTVTGLVSFDGAGNSDGKSVHMSGKLKADKLTLARNATPAPRTVDLDFAVEHDLKARSGVLSRGDIHIGGATVSLTGTYANQGDSMALKMNVSGANMPVTELQALLPALGIVLPAGSSFTSGVANVKLAAEGPADRLVTAGTVGLSNAKLAGFDMGRKMSTIETLAGINSGPNTEIQTLSMNVHSAPEGTTLDNIKLVATGIGEITGSGTISPSNALNFRMIATVHSAGLAAVVSNRPIPFLVQGTASDPAFRPDVKGLATETIESVVGGNAGKTAGGILKGLLGGKKQK
jgi:AsmA protein